MNAMQQPGTNLTYGTVQGTLRSDSTFLVFTSNWQKNIAKIPKSQRPNSRPTRGGQGGTLTLRPMDFKGAHHGARWLQRAHQNDTEKSAWGRTKTFFFLFGDHIKIWTKLWHFSRLFCSLQNQRSIIFELAPGSRSAFGAPGQTQCKSGLSNDMVCRSNYLLY